MGEIARQAAEQLRKSAETPNPRIAHLQATEAEFRAGITASLAGAQASLDRYRINTEDTQLILSAEAMQLLLEAFEFKPKASACDGEIILST